MLCRILLFMMFFALIAMSSEGNYLNDSMVAASVAGI